MTKSTTEMTILDEVAIAEIEARQARCMDNKNQSRLAEASILVASNIPALCHTVRVLRAENEALKADVARFSTLADERHDQLWEARRQRDSLAARHVEYTRDAMTAAIDDFRTHAVRICRDKADEYDKHPEAAHALRAVAGKLEQLK